MRQALPVQCILPRKLGICLVKLCLRRFHAGLGCRQVRLLFTRVQPGQHVAFGDAVTHIDAALGNAAADPEGERRLIAGLHLAGDGGRGRVIGQLRPLHDHRNDGSLGLGLGWPARRDKDE